MSKIKPSKYKKCRYCGTTEMYNISELEFTSESENDVWFYVQFDCKSCGKHNKLLFPQSLWILYSKMKRGLGEQ